jgi:hypothetical protein
MRIARIVRFPARFVKICPNEKSRSALPFADRLSIFWGTFRLPGPAASLSSAYGFTAAS